MPFLAFRMTATARRFWHSDATDGKPRKSCVDECALHRWQRLPLVTSRHYSASKSPIEMATSLYKNRAVEAFAHQEAST